MPVSIICQSRFGISILGAEAEGVVLGHGTCRAGGQAKGGVNVVGGLRIAEPAADLAIILAIASSYRNRPVYADLAIVGEVGLSGELRSVSQLPRRLHEAAKLGFKRALVPRSTLSRKGGDALPTDIEVLGPRTVHDALEMALVS